MDYVKPLTVSIEGRKEKEYVCLFTCVIITLYITRVNTNLIIRHKHCNSLKRILIFVDAGEYTAGTTRLCWEETERGLYIPLVKIAPLDVIGIQLHHY